MPEPLFLNIVANAVTVRAYYACMTSDSVLSGPPLPILLATVIGVFGVAPASAQSARPQFEVASVKLNPNCPDNQTKEQFSPGRVTVGCIKLKELLQAAYGTFANGTNSGLTHLQIFGEPSSLEPLRFDVTAAARADTPMGQMFGPMLQMLLEDRFHLKIHRETRELPVYALTVAKGGAKLQPAKAESCVPVDLNHANDAAPNFCGRMTGKPSGLHITDDAYGMTMADIAGKFLSNRLDRPVIDKTGLAGIFDAHLEFARDAALSAGSDEGPSIFTAVQEQLGLKLSPDKGPVEVLVIDHVERPSEN
jgi:uncharacterized protein (TIGR03435 family)